MLSFKSENQLISESLSLVEKLLWFFFHSHQWNYQLYEFLFSILIVISICLHNNPLCNLFSKGTVNSICRNTQLPSECSHYTVWNNIEGLMKVGYIIRLQRFYLWEDREVWLYEWNINNLSIMQELLFLVP